MKNDWHKQTLPFEEGGRIYFTYKSEFTETGGTDWERRKREGYRLGLISLLQFYDKNIQNIDFNDFFEEEYFDVYIDPRPNCGRIYFLVSIDFEVLKNIINNNPAVDDNLFTIEYTNINFRDRINKLISLLKKYDRKLTSKVLKETGIKVSFKNVIREINVFLKEFENIRIINGLTFYPNEIFNIKFSFDENNGIDTLFINNLPMFIGREYYRRTRKINNLHIQRILLNIDKLYELATNEEKQKDAINYIEASNIIFGHSFSISPNDSNLQNVLNFTNYVSGAKLDNVYVPCILKDFASDEFDDLIDKFNFTYGKDCGFLDIDIPVKYKNKDHLFEESKLIDHSKLKLDLHDQLIRIKEFTGDRKIKEIIDNDINAEDLKDLYEKVLNYLSFDELMKKVSDCLPKTGDIKDVCIELYNPLTIEFPDLNVKISGVFDVISDLVFKSILTISQKSIITLIENIFDRLVDCENGELEFYSINHGSDTLFGSNINLINKALNVKVQDQFENLVNARNFSLEYSEDIEKMLGIIAAILTPQELCSLVRGTPSAGTREILECVAEKTNFPDAGFVIDTFGELADLINLGDIYERIPSPTDSDPCITEEQYEARRELLRFKDKEIPEEVLDQQIQKAVDKLKEDIEFINKFVGDFKNGDGIVFNGKIQDAIQNSIPTVSKNENLRNITRSNVDSIISPLTLEANSKIVGADSIVTDIKNIGIDSIQNLMNDSGFVKVVNSDIVISDNLVYKIDNSLTFNNLTLESDSSGSYVNYKLYNFARPTKKFVRISPFNITEVVLGPSSSATVQNNSIQNQTNVFNPSALNLDSESSQYFYENVKEVIRHMYSVSYSTDIVLKGKSFIESSLKRDISQDTGFIENNWYSSGKPVREAILDDYLEYEEKTRNSDEYITSLVTGLIGYSSRISMLDFYLKNYNFMSNFLPTDINQGFISKYFEKTIELEEYFGSSRIPSYDDFLIDSASMTVSSLMDTFGSFERKSLVDIFIGSLSVISSKDEVFNIKENFYIYNNLEENTFELMHIIKKGDNDREVKSYAISGSIDALKVNQDVEFVFTKVFNLKEYISVLAIHNLVLYGAPKKLVDILECIDSVIVNLISDVSVGIDNPSETKYNSKKVSSSKSGDDPRVKTIRDLSLPWILDLLL